MRRPKVVRISRGNVSGEGPNKTVAKADLEKQVDWLLNAGSVVVEKRYHLLIIVAPIGGGWETKVMDPAQAEHGKPVWFSNLHGPEDRARVLDSCRLHAAQNAWTHDTNDFEHIALSGCSLDLQRELSSWCKFQRDYKALKDAGKTDQEAHAGACGYALPKVQA